MAQNYKCDIDPKSFPNGECPNFFRDAQGYIWQFSHTNADGKCCYGLLTVGRNRKKKKSSPKPCTICIVGETQGGGHTTPCSGTLQILNPALLDAPYSNTLIASGGTPPYIFTTNPLTLPPGLVLSPNGIISGIPNIPGGFIFTVQVTDSNGCIGLQEFRIAVVD